MIRSLHLPRAILLLSSFFAIAALTACSADGADDDSAGEDGDQGEPETARSEDAIRSGYCPVPIPLSGCHEIPNQARRQAQVVATCHLARAAPGASHCDASFTTGIGASCTVAKANAPVPRGCYKRHCQCR